MIIRYYIDPLSGMPHIYNHDVMEDEVAEILEDPGEDRIGREGTKIAIGQTMAGRYLKVIYVPETSEDSVFVITAYEIRGKQLSAYRRRYRKKHRTS